MESQDAGKFGKLWDREELILAFELYCRIPFQKTKASNSEVQKLARLLGRTPASVARKLGNFGAFDPELKKHDISGLIHVGRLDREIWEEFHHDWNHLVVLANELRVRLGDVAAQEELPQPPAGPSERKTIAKQRIHQSFFRDAVISSYDSRCCITGISVPECLIASHIVPWSADERFRADPTNGLCLSATFDRLFDSGLITITGDMRLLASPRLLGHRTAPNQDLLCAYNGRLILLPRRFPPAKERLSWHRENIFTG